jgi:aminoglycoside phosphotransferase (APT) family kinase protein
MNKTDRRSWLSLFEKKMRRPQSIEILREIDVGYLSIVYLVSVNGNQFAVKVYNKRYNGTEVCIKEANHIARARRSIPDAVPNVIFYSQHTENEFDREILVMERADGVPLTEEVFSEQVIEALTDVLKRLHSTPATNSKRDTNEVERITNCRKVITRFLKEANSVPKERVLKHLDNLEDYYLGKINASNNRETLVHGDLWWDNILVNNSKVKIVDWLESSEGDHCRDVAQLKIGTFDEILDAQKSRYYFKKVLDVYREDLGDESIYDRIRYYLPMMYLEESFYLPFKHFRWQIMYKEDPESFKKRFVEYLEKSEHFFAYEEI